jgi:hypothetical protein
VGHRTGVPLGGFRYPAASPTHARRAKTRAPATPIPSRINNPKGLCVGKPDIGPGVGAAGAEGMLRPDPRLAGASNPVRGPRRGAS